MNNCKHNYVPPSIAGDASLYERMGGIFAITAVVNDFSDAVVNDPLVGKESPNPQLRDWARNHLDRLPGLKFMRSLWVAKVSGGPYEYVPTKPGRCPTCLEEAHRGFKITSEEFDRVAQILSGTLDKYAVPVKEKQEVLDAFAAHKSEVLEGSVGHP